MVYQTNSEDFNIDEIKVKVENVSGIIKNLEKKIFQNNLTKYEYYKHIIYLKYEIDKTISVADLLVLLDSFNSEKQDLKPEETILNYTDSELNDIGLMKMIGRELEDEIFIDIISSESGIYRREIVEFAINALLDNHENKN